MAEGSSPSWPTPFLPEVLELSEHIVVRVGGAVGGGIGALGSGFWVGAGAGAAGGAAGGATGAAVQGGSATDILKASLIGAIGGAVGGGVGAATSRLGWAASSALASVSGGGASIGAQAGFGGSISLQDIGISIAAGVASGLASSAVSRVPEVSEALRQEAAQQSAGKAARLVAPAKGGFATAGAAAVDVLERAVTESHQINKEMGGLVYKQNGRFYATSAIYGNEGAVEVWDALGSVPKDATIVGDYHTHPRIAEGMAGWWNNGDVFSGTELPYVSAELRSMLGESVKDASDYYGAKKDIDPINPRAPNIDREAYTSFLSTPSGRLGVYNVLKDNVFYFSPNSRLLPNHPAIAPMSYAH